MTASHDTIRAEIKDRPSDELAILLLLVDSSDPSPETNLVKFAIGDELVARYPSIGLALDAWSESLSDPRTSAEVIIENLPSEVIDLMPRRLSD
jgi:hypothetical protein